MKHDGLFPEGDSDNLRPFYYGLVVLMSIAGFVCLWFTLSAHYYYYPENPKGSAIRFPSDESDEYYLTITSHLRTRVSEQEWKETQRNERMRDRALLIGLSCFFTSCASAGLAYFLGLQRSTKVEFVVYFVLGTLFLMFLIVATIINLF